MCTKNYWHAIREHERDIINNERGIVLARTFIYFFLFIYISPIYLFSSCVHCAKLIRSFLRDVKNYSRSNYISIEKLNPLVSLIIPQLFLIFIYSFIFHARKMCYFFFFPNSSSSKYIRKTHRTPLIAVLVSKV